MFDHFRICVYVDDSMFLCKIGIQSNMLVKQCVLMHVFQKGPWCVLTTACELIRTNMVINLILICMAMSNIISNPFLGPK